MNMKVRFFPENRALLILVSFLWMNPSKGMSADSTRLTIEQLRAQRTELAHRPRRIIMNNDGCDVLYFPKSEEVTVPAFLARRTTPLAGTQVDAIAYCSISSGFGNFTHNTKAGTVLARDGSESGYQPDMRNIARDLIGSGTDCLRAVVDFAHRHDMEAFWSMRMNDTHDAAQRPDKPHFLFPQLKVEHPGWLVGNPVDRTPFGRWSSVDYAVPEIRDLAFRYIEEVCGNYDIDGVELDFFRHLCYFKSTAEGGVASDEEREMVTGLMRRVRDMTEKRGLERGRPILVAVRVPDSAGYCRDMGFDLENWLREGLVDLLITTGYFRLNPWEYSVALGHEHGVAVYPCLSDTRVRGESRFRRSSPESFRGRAMNAWRAGADGIHVFNSFDPKSAHWGEAGDPEVLAGLDKLYFVHVRDGDPRTFLAGGRDYQKVEWLGPSHERQLKPGAPVQVELMVGDDLATAAAQGRKPVVKLHLEIPGAAGAEKLAVSVNGTELDRGVARDGWIDLGVPASAMRCGKNEIRLEALGVLPPDDAWEIRFDGREKLGRSWERDRGSERTIVEERDGALAIADRGENPGDYLYCRHPWGLDAQGQAIVEFEARVRSGSSYLIFMNGESGERIGLWPDRIEFHHQKGLRFDLNTTDAFHRYRVEIAGRDVKVFVDGKPVIDAPGRLAPRSGYERHEIAFGAANSPQTGEAEWRSLRARATGAICRDLVLSVAFEE